MKGTQIGIGVLGSVLAFAVAGPAGAIIVAWLLVSPDAAATTARGGGAGAIGAAAKAAGGYLANEWRAGGPARHQRRTARRQRWHDAGGWRTKLLAGEHALVLIGRGLRTGVVAIAMAVVVLPAGARAGAEAARREYRARKGDDPADTPRPPDADPSRGENPSTTDGEKGPRPSRIVHHDAMNLVIQAHGKTCPRCGIPWQPEIVSLSDGSQLARMRCPNCRAWRTAHEGEIPTDGPPPRVPPEDSGTPDSGGGPVTGQAPPQPQPTGDGMTQTDDTTAHAGGAELTNTGDLRAEVIAMQTLIEEAEILGALMQEWQAGLPDAYEAGAAAGGPKTRALDEAVAAVAEAGADGQAFGEALGEIRIACDEADGLGEYASAMGADGHTKGYASA